MKLCIRVVLQLAALALALAGPSFAAEESYLYIIHDLPGRDVAANLNPGLPIDILINGKSCLVRGLTFGNTSGPLTLAPGEYDVQISLSNTLAPCTNPALITSQVTLVDGGSISAVATISGGQPTLLSFNDNLSPVTSGNARFVFSNAADAPALQATLTQLYVKTPKTYTITADQGAEAALIVLAGTYRVDITVPGATTVLTSQQLTLNSQDANFSYAGGEALNNSFTLVDRTIREVF
jgi:Domain of unknown function (DUF4397)